MLEISTDTFPCCINLNMSVALLVFLEKKNDHFPHHSFVLKILDSASAKLRPLVQSPLAMHTHLLGNVGTHVDRESQGQVCSLHKVTQLFTTLKLKTERWRPKMVTCSFKLPVQETTRKTARLPMSYFPAPGYPTHSHHLTVSKHCPISLSP